MKHVYLCLIILFPLVVNSQENMNKKTDSLQTVASVEIYRYMGQWYEIAQYPTKFQKGCECTTAEYYLNVKDVTVINTCKKNGKEKKIKGKAFIVPNSNNAKLKVQFFWPFKGDYWIISLDKDYNWAVVSNPDRNYLWILSRSKKMAPELYQKIITDLVSRGFDESRIVKTKQDCSN